MDKKQEEQYQRALKLLGDKKWIAAAAILEELVNDVPSDEITKQLVRSLYFAKQYARAFVYFVEQPTIFTTDQENARLAVQLLLHNQSYISARLFIAALKVEWRKGLLKLVAVAEDEARQDYQITIKTLLRSFYHLGDYSLDEQQSRLSEAQQLPLEEYLTGAQFLLRDPFTHQLIKASLVDTLRQLGVAQAVIIRWVDGNEYSLIPADLLAIDDMQLVQALRRELNERLANDNPSELQLANQELQMQLMLMYPLINQKISDVAEWDQAIISRIRGEKVTANPKIINLQDQLTKIIDDLSEKH